MKMYKITQTVPTYENPTPSDLMNRFAMNNPKASFERDKYFEPYLFIDGKRFYYDHWQIGTPTPSHITITVFLKEKEA